MIHKIWRQSSWKGSKRQNYMFKIMFLKSNFHFKVWPRKLSHAASKSHIFLYMNIWITLEVTLMSRLKVQHWPVRLLQIWWPCHVIWCCLLDEHLLPLVYPLLSLPPLSCILYRQCQQGPVLTSAISTLAFSLFLRCMLLLTCASCILCPALFSTPQSWVG